MRCQLEHVLGPLTGKQQQLVQTLEVIRIEHDPRCRIGGARRWRGPSGQGGLRPATTACSGPVGPDVVLRRVCGWEQVGLLARLADPPRRPQRVHEALLVGHLSRDSTAIEPVSRPREKAPPPLKASGGGRRRAKNNRRSCLERRRPCTCRRCWTTSDRLLSARRRTARATRTPVGYKLTCIPISCLLTSTARRWPRRSSMDAASPGAQPLTC